jgi:hypothetical protein
MGMAGRVQDQTRRKAGTRQRTRSRRSPAERPSVVKEWRQAERTVAMFERLMSTAGREAQKHRDSRTAAEIEDLAWEYVRESDPVRISHAQKILGVSNQTVRSWIDEGILDGFGGSPQRVGLESVVRAKRIADELREQGHDREIMTAVLSRLEALALEKDKAFRRSVGQMRRQERRPRPY